MKLQRSVMSRGLANRPPGTKLWRSGTKGRRRPGTTHDCVNLGLRRPESVVVVRNIKHVCVEYSIIDN